MGKYVKSLDGQTTYLATGDGYVPVDGVTKEVKPGGTVLSLADPTFAHTTGAEVVVDAVGNIITGTSKDPGVIGSKEQHWSKGKTDAVSENWHNAGVTTNINKQQFADFQQDPAYKQLIVGRGIYDATRGLLRAMYGQDIGESSVDKYINETRNKYENANAAYSRDNINVAGTPATYGKEESHAVNNSGGETNSYVDPPQTIDQTAVSLGTWFGGNFRSNGKGQWVSDGVVSSPWNDAIKDEWRNDPNLEKNKNYKTIKKLLRPSSSRLEITDDELPFLNSIASKFAVRGKTTGIAPASK